MKPLVSATILSLLLINGFALAQPESKQRTAVKRGREAVRGRPAVSPAVWPALAYDNVWKQWGLKEKPANYARAFRERYGLHAAPYRNDGLPMGLHIAPAGLFKGIDNDCLLCHAGRIAGRTIIGAGNASLDLEALFNELSAASGFGRKMPFYFSHVRGTIDPLSSLAFLMQFRDPDLNFTKAQPLDYFDNVCSDPPAWWLLKKKKTRQWTGNLDARSKRVDMVNLLHPLNSGANIKKQESFFADIHAFVLSVDAPKYPIAINEKLAARGQTLFEQTCARCHGTYGAKGEYPNKIVPLKVIGTDPVLAEALSQKNLDFYNKSWFAQEKGPDGKPFHVIETGGYQAPPLDGIWATAPYFHNCSAPTIYHVLNSKARPKYFTRSYGTDKEHYDTTNVGWRITELNRPADPQSPGVERRKIYDTTLPGQSNRGHTFGDEFSDEQRRAVIEYLKTL